MSPEEEEKRKIMIHKMATRLPFIVCILSVLATLLFIIQAYLTFY